MQEIFQIIYPEDPVRKLQTTEILPEIRDNEKRNLVRSGIMKQERNSVELY